MYLSEIFFVGTLIDIVLRLLCISLIIFYFCKMHKCEHFSCRILNIYQNVVSIKLERHKS